VVSSHQWDWNERLPSLPAYWTSTHETTGVTPPTMVFGRELRCVLRPDVRCSPRQKTFGDKLYSRPRRTTTRHPPFLPPTPESGLRPNGLLGSFLTGRKIVAVPTHPERGEVSQATDMLGRYLYHHYPHKRRIRVSEAFPGKNEGRPSGQVGVVPGGFSRSVALRIVQCSIQKREEFGPF
jgi:hypothetical protein